MSTEIEPPEGWQVVDGKLHREFAFGDFAEAFAFMARVAAEAERLDHHPDWSNSWNRVVIDLVTHEAGGITELDRSLAVAISAQELAATVQTSRDQGPGTSPPGEPAADDASP